MKNQPKTLARANRPALTPTTEQWHTADAALTVLSTAFEPLLLRLTEAELAELLTVGNANESFTRDYVALVTAEPNLLPGYLNSAMIVADWKIREDLIARAQAIAKLMERIADTVKALQSDCYAAALNGYRVLKQGGVPAGYVSAIAPLRAQMQERVQARRETRAKNLALKAAKDALAAVQPPSGSNGAPTPAAVIVPMDAAVPASLAA